MIMLGPISVTILALLFLSAGFSRLPPFLVTRWLKQPQVSYSHKAKVNGKGKYFYLSETSVKGSWLLIGSDLVTCQSMR